MDFENGKDADYVAEVKVKALSGHETVDETADEPTLNEREARSEKTRAFMKKHRAAISICSILLVVLTTLTSMFFAGVFGDMFVTGEEEEEEIADGTTVTYYYHGVMFELKKSGASFIVVGCNNESANNTTLYIPRSYNGIPVKEIAYRAFCYTDFYYVNIPDTITNIGAYAFYGCDDLTSISIPSRVKTIGEFAFYGCSSLSRVTIPVGVTSIGNSAFANAGIPTIYMENFADPAGYDSGWARDCKVVYGANINSIPPA